MKIELKNVSFSYGKQEVFKDFNLTINDNEMVAILGHNGSGKSTIAKMIMGLLEINKGNIYLNDERLTEENVDRLRLDLGIIFQNPDNQIVANVVEEDVAFAPENLGVASPMIRHRVDNALKQVGMYHYRTHAPHLLSGGQKQRIAIAGVIAMEPKCIVLDEPTAMLDPKGRREVMETIARLNREKGITVVLITHHMDEAAKADRVVVIHRGVVRADGKPKDVFSGIEYMHELGLAAPETVELCHELNGLGFDLPLDLLETEDCAQAIYKALGGN